MRRAAILEQLAKMQGTGAMSNAEREQITKAGPAAPLALDSAVKGQGVMSAADRDAMRASTPTPSDKGLGAMSNADREALRKRRR